MADGEARSSDLDSTSYAQPDKAASETHPAFIGQAEGAVDTSMLRIVGIVFVLASFAKSRHCADSAARVDVGRLLGRRRPQPHRSWSQRYVKFLVVGDSGLVHLL